MRGSLENIDQLLNMLENVLETNVELVSKADLKEEVLGEHVEWIPLTTVKQDDIGVLIHKSLTHNEKKLISSFIHVLVVQNDTSFSESLSPYESCRRWLIQSLDNGNSTPPLELGSIQWELGKVPFLLQGRTNASLASEEVLHLIHSYIKESDLMSDTDKEPLWTFALRPNQYLFCVPLHAYFDEELALEDNDKDLLGMIESWAEGLNELLQAELGQTFRISFYEPIYSPIQLVNVLTVLEKTQQLANRFKWKKNTYSYRDIAVLQLLEPLSTDMMERILNQLWSAVDQTLLQENELRTTFEHFFEENLNVSETARKLYVHRNTLLYRLEKFKQETGYDVRIFDEALIVRLSMLMLQALRTK